MTPPRRSSSADAQHGDPLAVVRRAILAQARAEADEILAAARLEGERLVAQASEDAGKVREEARVQGEADAWAVVEVERARARRHARAVVLRARRQAYESLGRQVRDAVASLRQDPVYPQLRERLAAEARATLGPEAVLRDVPEGGVVGEHGDRQVVCTLDVLAERVLEALAPESEGLWAAT